MKITESLFKIKDSFIPQYGRNTSRRFGRRMLRDEEVVVFDKKCLVTKDYVQKSYLKQETIRCTEEVLDLLNCLAANEYDSKQCTKEYSRAKLCKEKEKKLETDNKIQANMTLLPDLASDLNITQINKLLAHYKVPIDKKKMH